MSFSFRRWLATPFTTKRSPALAVGKRGTPADHLTDPALRCMPIDPANGQTAQEIAVRLKDILKAPFRIMETFVDVSLDIADGDILVANGRSYPIRQVERWEWRPGEIYLHVMLEDSAA